MVMSPRFLLAVLVAAPLWAEDAAGAARPAPTWAEAKSLGVKLEAIEKRYQTKAPRRPQSVLVTERELNSYLNLAYAPQMPPGLSDVDVRLDAQRIHATGLLDLEKVRGKVPPPSPWSPLAFLTGKVPIELKGTLTTSNGFGTIEIEEAWISSVRVPMSFLEQIVTSATKKPSDPDGFDINAPFRLPYAVSRVRLESARAFLDF